MEQQLKTARQKKAEDEKVQKEEVSKIKIHDEDLRRQEAIGQDLKPGKKRPTYIHAGDR
jgi:hypothetical protein